MARPAVPEPFYRTKPDIAIKEIDRVIAAGVRFGCVLADRGYGLSAQFRQAISARGLCWAVRIPRHQKVYPADVQLIFPLTGRGRARLYEIPAAATYQAAQQQSHTRALRLGGGAGLGRASRVRQHGKSVRIL